MEELDPEAVQEMGQRIKDRRQHLRRSQESIAQQVGVKQQAVNAWEKGKRIPRPREAVSLGRVLGVPPAWFFEPLFGETSTIRDPLAQVREIRHELDRLERLLVGDASTMAAETGPPPYESDG